MKASLFILSILSIFASYAAADCCFTSRDNVRMSRGPYSPFKFLFSLVFFTNRCAKMESQGNHTAESEVISLLIPGEEFIKDLSNTLLMVDCNFIGCDCEGGCR